MRGQYSRKPAPRTMSADMDKWERDNAKAKLAEVGPEKLQAALATVKALFANAGGVPRPESAPTPKHSTTEKV